MRKDRGISREEEPVLLLDKGKQGIFHLIFGRTGVVILLLLVQLGLYLAAFMRLQELYYGPAILLSLVSRLSRKARIADASQETILNSSERAGAYLLERFAGERRELVFLLCLDRKGRLLACKRLAEGDVASADLNIRKVVEMALLTSASAVILAHNHPSGVAVPSSSDEAATRQVAEALRTIGVRLVDHIVVADRDFVSMADSGDLLG